MGKRGPPAIPTKLKLLRGNPGKKRLNLYEPEPVQPSEVPEPPEFLTGYAREEWHRIILELFRLRLVTLVDLNPLAAYCQAYKRWRTAEEKLAVMAERDPIAAGLLVKSKQQALAANPLVAIADNAARSMVRYAAEFGLTPAARTRLSSENRAEPSQPTSKFAGLLAS